jgi:hypothetical protein
VKFAYGRLPSGQGPLPVVGLELLHAPGLRVPALIDSGAGGVRLDAALAPAVGVDLSAYKPWPLAIGGHGRLLAYDVPDIRLGISRTAWTTTVSFVDPWPFAHAVLGTTGFFDSWTVRFDKRRDQFALIR